MTREKNINNYRDFEGSDASLSESLYCYGLIWKQVKDDYKIIYGVDTDNNGDYNKFSWAYLPINTDVYAEYDWADFDAVLSFTGETKEHWNNLPLMQKISDLLRYYGFAEIFGQDFEGYKITGNESI